MRYHNKTWDWLSRSERVQKRCLCATDTDIKTCTFRNIEVLPVFRLSLGGENKKGDVASPMQQPSQASGAWRHLFLSLLSVRPYFLQAFAFRYRQSTPLMQALGPSLSFCYAFPSPGTRWYNDVSNEFTRLRTVIRQLSFSIINPGSERSTPFFTVLRLIELVNYLV